MMFTPSHASNIHAIWCQSNVRGKSGAILVPACNGRVELCGHIHIRTLLHIQVLSTRSHGSILNGVNPLVYTLMCAALHHGIMHEEYAKVIPLVVHTHRLMLFMPKCDRTMNFWHRSG